MRATTSDVLKIYWRPLRSHTLLITGMVLALVVGSVADLFAPLYYKQFFDVMAAGPGGEGVMATLVRLLFIVLIVHLISWLGWRYSSFMNNYLQTKVMGDLKEISFEYLLGHSYGFFSTSFGGALVQKINRLSRSFERFSDRIYWSLIPLVIKLFGTAIVIWLFHPYVGALITGWIIVFFGINIVFAQWKIKYDIATADQDSKVTGTLADAITNHTNIQIFNGHLFETNIFRAVNKTWRQLIKFSWDLNAGFEAVQSLLFFGIEFLLFYFALRYWNTGILTIGTFVLIQAYLFMLLGTLWDSGKIARDIYQSVADAKEMVEIMNRPYDVADAPGAGTLRLTKGTITFEDIHFYFYETRPVLRGLNLTVQPGEKIALVGSSGAGKSTIVKLLFRFYDVAGGRILIDGQDIHRMTQESLRAQLGLVPQDPILFHRTLMENIRYGRREATDEEVVAAAKLAHCHEFITAFPDQYQTYVGERGIKLSGGERQRVAIARAMLKNAPILVLDEATSSLDSESEMFIQDALSKLMEGKTVIVIAHRLSTIRRMDRIVVIEEGRMSEEGTHDELLARTESLYQKLWTLQAGGFIPEEDDETEEKKEAGNLN